MTQVKKPTRAPAKDGIEHRKQGSFIQKPDVPKGIKIPGGINIPAGNPPKGSKKQ